MANTPLTNTPLKKGELAPLDVQCADSACERDLHSFAKSSKRRPDQEGRCRSCGVDLIDWDRVRMCNLDDAEFTFYSLQYEYVRHHYWHTPFDEDAVNYARRKGKVGMRAAADRRIRSSVGRAANSFDGRQTGKKGNPLYYAQHATATCCRKCIRAWHGIPSDRDLDDPEVSYLAQLVNLYIAKRMPYLTQDGEKVPYRRASNASKEENR